ncbi:hypothetical protein VNO78_19571 [Psophocarpus tetragonolobus]|uniref:Pentatricopeptide repeat-containing protein n=1 Tax=Psophocarpus tetragonolobus TaxID=3891 RepID=A0AAN9S9M9_PSOTE
MEERNQILHPSPDSPSGPLHLVSQQQTQPPPLLSRRHSLLLRFAPNLLTSNTLNALPPYRRTYNILVHGYCRLKWLKDASQVIHLMSKEGGGSNRILLLSTPYYTLCGEKKLEEAYDLIVKARKRGYILDEVTYGTLIIGYFKGHQEDKALKLWEEMKDRGIAPSVVTYNTLIRGLCLSGKTDQAVDTLNELLEKGLALTRLPVI